MRPDENAGEAAVRQLVCPRCEARPTVRCTTMSGKPAETHAARWQPLAEAYARGHEDGSRG